MPSNEDQGIGEIKAFCESRHSPRPEHPPESRHSPHPDSSPISGIFGANRYAHTRTRVRIIYALYNVDRGFKR
jgi:hypothetical protein